MSKKDTVHLGGDIEVYLIVIQRATIYQGNLEGDLNATNLSASDESTHTFFAISCSVSLRHTVRCYETDLYAILASGPFQLLSLKLWDGRKPLKFCLGFTKKL